MSISEQAGEPPGDALAEELKGLEACLTRLAAGDPSARLAPSTGVCRFPGLHSAINRTAEYFEETVELCHEFAMGLAEHFDVLSRLAEGDLGARVKGRSPVELVQALSDVTNQTVASLQDASVERGRAEEAVRRSERLLRLVIDSNPCAIAVKDSAGRYLLANETLGRLYGLAPAQLIGETDQLLVAHGVLGVDEVARRESEEQAVLHTGSMRVMPSRELVLTNGQAFTFQTMLLPFSAGGADPGPASALLSVWVDVTAQRKAVEERMALEAQLRQAQKMEAIGTLAGGIAHDFRNILGAVLGYAEIALFEAENGQVVPQVLEELLAAGRRAQQLVGRLLTFSRKSETHELRPLELGHVVKEGIALLRASLPSTIEIATTVGDPALVIGDATQIHQVLMNLGTNAAYAMQPRGGTLTISLDHLSGTQEISLQGQPIVGPCVRLTVRDTGCGMPPGLIERIFEPFFTTKPRHEGTGLGLAVVHGIVRSHGGALAVESTPGVGTTFRVTLPEVHQLPAPEEQPLLALPHGTETVLFVDDEYHLVRIGEELLGRLGYTVIGRTSSVEALAAFRKRAGEIDLAITDLTMPNLSGTELATELLRIKPGLPIILVTGFAEHTAAEHAPGQGTYLTAVKPLLLRELAQLVRNALDQRSLRGAVGPSHGE